VRRLVSVSRSSAGRRKDGRNGRLVKCGARCGPRGGPYPGARKLAPVPPPKPPGGGTGPVVPSRRSRDPRHLRGRISGSHDSLSFSEIPNPCHGEAAQCAAGRWAHQSESLSQGVLGEGQPRACERQGEGPARPALCAAYLPFHFTGRVARGCTSTRWAMRRKAGPWSTGAPVMYCHRCTISCRMVCSASPSAPRVHRR
jgi:hypothetical protein